MTSINYNEIYSRFYSKVEAYDLLKENLSDDLRNEFLCNWLRSSLSKPYVRRLFSSISYEDNLEELNYEMKYVVDEDSDKEFIIEVLSFGMIVSWLTPKINSITNISQMFGTSDEKFYSQSSHLSGIKSIRDDAQKEQRSMITDRGYVWNTYLDGDS